MKKYILKGAHLNIIKLHENPLLDCHCFNKYTSNGT